MGLELVEIVIEVENTFGIRLGDDEAGGIVTPGDLCDVIVKKLRARDACPCLSAGVFFRLRGAFAGTLGTDPAVFRPRTALADLLPRRRRRHLWNAIGLAAGLELPELRRPEWMRAGAFVLLLMVLPLAGMLAAVRHGIPLVSAVMLGCAGLAILWVLLRWLTGGFAICLPRDCRTVAAAVRRVVDHNYGRAGVRSKAWDEGQIWARLQGIIAGATGLEAAEVTRQAHLIRDLGCG